MTTTAIRHPIVPSREAWMLAVPVLFAAVLSLHPTLSWAGEDEQAAAAISRQITGACNQTTAAAGSACTRQVRADVFLALGICVNEGNAVQRRDCFAEAYELRNETRALCNHQAQARSKVCRALGQAPYDPSIRPSDFSRSTTIDNPYFPLIPGDVYVYKGKAETITLKVLDETVEILGIQCRAVRDTVVSNEDSGLVEDTTDYYAQDDRGNVWYFGEATAEFENGVAVTNAGAWIAGVAGAKPGIVMLADPKPGRTYRQEFALGEAEDLARVVALKVPVQVPAGTYNTLKTFDFTPIDPEVRENKYYAAGVGAVLMVDLATGESEKLISRAHRK